MFNKLKQKIADHKEEVVVYSMVGAAVAGYVAFCVYAIKAYNQAVEDQREFNDKLTDALEDGKAFTLYADGRIKFAGE